MCHGLPPNSRPLEPSRYGGKPCESCSGRLSPKTAIAVRHGLERWYIVPYGRPVPFQTVAHGKVRLPSPGRELRGNYSLLSGHFLSSFFCQAFLPDRLPSLSKWRSRYGQCRHGRMLTDKTGPGVMLNEVLRSAREHAGVVGNRGRRFLRKTVHLGGQHDCHAPAVYRDHAWAIRTARSGHPSGRPLPAVLGGLCRNGLVPAGQSLSPAGTEPSSTCDASSPGTSSPMRDAAAEQQMIRRALAELPDRDALQARLENLIQVNPSPNDPAWLELYVDACRLVARCDWNRSSTDLRSLSSPNTTRWAAPTMRIPRGNRMPRTSGILCRARHFACCNTTDRRCTSKRWSMTRRACCEIPTSRTMAAAFSSPGRNRTSMTTTTSTRWILIPGKFASLPTA